MIIESRSSCVVVRKIIGVCAIILLVIDYYLSMRLCLFAFSEKVCNR